MDAVDSVQKEKGLVVSVGYMLRYHPVIEKMREVLKEHGRKPLYIHGFYNLAYSAHAQPFWWDMRKSGGPIVEEATHFCDLLRYLGGEVDEASIGAVCVPPSDLPTDAGYLTSVHKIVKERDIPLEHRIPRFELRTGRNQPEVHDTISNEPDSVERNQSELVPVPNETESVERNKPEFVPFQMNQNL